MTFQQLFRISLNMEGFSSRWFITLIPKSINTSLPSDYRPISLTSDLYKLIARIISKCLKGIMDTIINPSQSAFLPSRYISDNILLCHDLMRISYLKKGPQSGASPFQAD